jgi:trichothecene 3-O-acetyltransferase
MDGNCMSIFGKTWAKHVRAVAEGLHVQEFLNSDILDRTKVFADKCFCEELSEIPNCRVLKHGLRGDFERELLDVAIAEDSSRSAYRITQQLRSTYWNISREFMQEITQASMPKTPDAPVLTENAVLSALIWRHITRARQLSSLGVKLSCILTAINVRARLKPALPPDYPGNAVANAKAIATSVDVETELPLYELARQISDSINWWTSERVWGFIAAVDKCPQVNKV